MTNVFAVIDSTARGISNSSHATPIFCSSRHCIAARMRSDNPNVFAKNRE